MKPRAEGGNFV